MLIALAVLAILVIAVVVIGGLLPKDHRASRTVRFKQTPERIWLALTDVRHYPAWRSNVKEVEVLSSNAGKLAWREKYKNGQSIPFEVQQSDSPKKMVIRIADPKLPFGGTWTFSLVPVAESTELTITEDGYITNPVFRFMARFVLGYHKTLDDYLLGLKKAMGEK